MNEYEERIRALEAQLAKCKEKISALTRNRYDEAGVHGASHVSANESAERTAELEEKSHALERANFELRNLTENLDRIVRRRTQALAESEAQLRRTNEELRRSNQTRREFVSIAAHELRTPLTSIVGYLELIFEGRFGMLPEPCERPMASVRRNALRLRRLVDDMLDVSRIESERMVLNANQCSLESIARAVVEELRPLADTREQSMAAMFSECPLILADGDKIHQVISNLVANAIRYTPVGGEISVGVERAPAEQYSEQWALLRVRDNGPGIDPSDLDAIFEPFSDVHPAKHHTSSGPAAAGLGLYIARGLVELHGGVIRVSSRVGKYTEFTVLLPGVPAEER